MIFQHIKDFWRLILEAVKRGLALLNLGNQFKKEAEVMQKVLEKDSVPDYSAEEWAKRLEPIKLKENELKIEAAKQARLKEGKKRPVHKWACPSCKNFVSCCDHAKVGEGVLCIDFAKLKISILKGGLDGTTKDHVSQTN